MKIHEITKHSNVAIQTIGPEKTVHSAARKLVEYNIGALPVCDDTGELIGIISERDILRLCAGEEPKAAMEQKVAAVMTRNLVTSAPDDDVEHAMRVMTERRIRHLPILENDHLVNIISIGDLVKSKLEGAATEIRFLRDYVAG